MSHTKSLARWIGLAALAGASSAVAGINGWTMRGPDSGWATAIAISPDPNSQVTLASTPAGVYRSTNGGANWSLVTSAALSPRNISFDPTNPNRVFLANSRVWVSNDAGANWALGPEPEFGARQVEASSSGVVYLQTLSAHMFRSTDQGATWTPCGAPWGTDAASNAFTVYRDSSGKDYLFMEVRRPTPAANGTWRSLDGCATWTQSAAGSPASGTDELVYNYDVMQGNPNRVLAATSVGVKLSTDGGDHWNIVTVAPAHWAEFDPNSPAGDAVALVQNTRVLRSSDQGEHWIIQGTNRAPGDSMFALDPHVAGRMLLGTRNGVFVSTDYGSTYTPRNHGMNAGDVGNFSVADDGTVYASFYLGAGGAFRRDPVTGNWGPVDNSALLAATIADDFEVTYVATAPSNPARLYVGNRVFSLASSTDSGTTWTPSHAAFRNMAVVPANTAVDPDNELVAYTATSNRGIWKTTDGGQNWAEFGTGLPCCMRFVAAARGSDTVYAMGNDNTTYIDSIYKSVNGGATWTATGAAPIAPFQGVFNDLVIDPRNPDVVYAPFFAGIYKTTNGGTSWTLMDFPGQADPVSSYGLSIDPEFSSTVVVSNFSYGGILRTVDGGLHWQPIPLGIWPNAPIPKRVLIDPAHPSLIIASTSGQGVGDYEIANDLAVGGLGIAPTLSTSTSFEYPFLVKNYGPHGASPSKLTIGFPAWLTPTVPGNCVRTGQTLACDIPALNVDDLVRVNVTFAVSAAGGSGSLTASLTGHETELISGNNTHTQAITATERADLRLAFTPASISIDRNDSATVVARVTNLGPSPSTGTTLALQLPAGLSWTTPTPSAGTCTQSGQAINCSLGTLAVGASASVSLPVQGSSVGTQTITGAADGSGVDSGVDQNATVDVVVGPVGDLSVGLAESEDPVTVGAQLTYSVTLRNLSGDAGAASVVIPVSGAALTGVGVTPGVTCSANLATNTASCAVQSLAAGASAVGYVHITGSLPGIATATATATFGGRDTNLLNNLATIGTTIRLVGDASVEIGGPADPASVSLPFTYSVTVRNAGPNAGTVNVAIPVLGANISTASTPAGSCTALTGTANCTIPSLASGDSAVITITAFAAAPGTASATATATFVGFDPNPANNAATTGTQVRAVADIGVSIAESADPVSAGAVLSYRVTLTTAGPSPGNVHLAVPLTGSTVTGATPSQGGVCTIAGGTVSCDFAPMDFSPSTVDILVNSATAGTVTATATATFSGTDPVAANNTATASTTVSAAPSSSSSSGGGSSSSGGGGGSSSSSSSSSSGGGGSSSSGSSSSSSGGGGGGGGGGRFDWLVLAALAALSFGRAAARRITWTFA
jgi:hypothetical protein